MQPKPTAEAFDDWLTEHSLQLEAVVVGGAALALLGTTSRQTRDFELVDALAPTIAELEEAKPWLSEQDANPLWPEHVSATLDDLSRRLKYGV